MKFYYRGSTVDEHVYSQAMLKKEVEQYVSSKEAELEEQKAREESKKAQELAEGRLANMELEKFRERVSYITSPPPLLLPSPSICPSDLLPKWAKCFYVV